MLNLKYDVLKDSDALVLLTEWKEFRSPDFDKIKSELKPQLFLMDEINILLMIWKIKD